MLKEKMLEALHEKDCSVRSSSYQSLDFFCFAFLNSLQGLMHMIQTTDTFLNPETAFHDRTGIMQIQEESIFPNVFS